MSLLGTYVLCNNGKWYLNPCWWGSMMGRWWFICFDSEDPPEIVIAEAHGQDMVAALSDQILTGIGVKFKLEKAAHVSQGCSRCFPQDGQKKFKQAGSWFFTWEEPPPPPQFPSGGRDERPTMESVYYDFVHRQA